MGNIETENKIMPKKPRKKKRLIGQSWLSVAQERIDAGEPEHRVMKDYGYVCNDKKDGMIGFHNQKEEKCPTKNS